MLPAAAARMRRAGAAGAPRRRFLIAHALLLSALAGLWALGAVTPPAPPDPAANRLIYTLDRGGVVRFNNGKVDVESAFAFTLNDGPLQVPRVIADWEGVDFPLNLAAYTALSPELIINRAYRAAGDERITFSVVGSTTSRKLHRPEICYRAADWAVTELPVHTVALEAGEIGVDRFLARSDATGEHWLVLDWYLWRDGRRRIEDGAFVMQVAAPLDGRSLEAASASAERFIRQIFRRTVGSERSALIVEAGYEGTDFGA